MCPETGLGRKKNIKSDREMDNLFFYTLYSISKFLQWALS